MTENAWITSSSRKEKIFEKEKIPEKFKKIILREKKRTLKKVKKHLNQEETPWKSFQEAILKENKNPKQMLKMLSQKNLKS
jgi:predicted patatin/cPLA2 family phospholipase